VHGRLTNFAKIKHIIDVEREEAEVLFLVAGDLFSGNPVVDSHDEKGYPLIDIMNRVGVDLTVIGNHEYDYGEESLKDRIDQADFDFICANVDTEGAKISQPEAFKKITVGDLDVVILGLVETNGSDAEIIPSTHPWRVNNLKFSRPETVVGQYSDLKNEQNADLFVALTHLGHDGYNGALGDYQLATDFPYFDLIVGGHSHREIDTIVNDIPIYQAGSYLRKLGRIDLEITNRQITSINYSMIDLDTYAEEDAELAEIINGYENQPYLQDVIGYSAAYHGIRDVGCFVTDALRTEVMVDVAIHNSGGVRDDLDEGDITKRDIYEISPFNNGTVIYNITVGELEEFFKQSGSGFYYSGIIIEQEMRSISIRDADGIRLKSDVVLRLVSNDYIAAVHEQYLPRNFEVRDATQAETVIAYLINHDQPVNVVGCERYFRYSD
jgi:2',3'-cyclic-nucleotide 2'-phosphodiesterase (5'-nucleotidase family)